MRSSPDGGSETCFLWSAPAEEPHTSSALTQRWPRHNALLLLLLLHPHLSPLPRPHTSTALVTCSNTPTRLFCCECASDKPLGFLPTCRCRTCQVPTTFQTQPAPMATEHAAAPTFSGPNFNHFQSSPAFTKPQPGVFVTSTRFNYPAAMEHRTPPPNHLQQHARRSSVPYNGSFRRSHTTGDMTSTHDCAYLPLPCSFAQNAKHACSRCQ